jgi:hypothetical protein
VFRKLQKLAQILGLLFSTVPVNELLEKNGWTRFCATISQTHLVTLAVGISAPLEFRITAPFINVNAIT